MHAPDTLTDMRTGAEQTWVQLATRIPKRLHHELRLHCVRSDLKLMDFVVQAIEERLRRESGGRAKQDRPRA